MRPKTVVSKREEELAALDAAGTFDVDIDRFMRSAERSLTEWASPIVEPGPARAERYERGRVSSGQLQEVVRDRDEQLAGVGFSFSCDVHELVTLANFDKHVYAGRECAGGPFGAPYKLTATDVAHARCALVQLLRWSAATGCRLILTSNRILAEHTAATNMTSFHRGRKALSLIGVTFHHVRHDSGRSRGLAVVLPSLPSRSQAATARQLPASSLACALADGEQIPLCEAKDLIPHGLTTSFQLKEKKVSPKSTANPPPNPSSNARQAFWRSPETRRSDLNQHRAVRVRTRQRGEGLSLGIEPKGHVNYRRTPAVSLTSCMAAWSRHSELGSPQLYRTQRAALERRLRELVELVGADEVDRRISTWLDDLESSLPSRRTDGRSVPRFSWIFSFLSRQIAVETRSAADISFNAPSSDQRRRFAASIADRLADAGGSVALSLIGAASDVELGLGSRRRAVRVAQLHGDVRGFQLVMNDPASALAVDAAVRAAGFAAFTLTGPRPLDLNQTYFAVEAARRQVGSVLPPAVGSAAGLNDVNRALHRGLSVLDAYDESSLLRSLSAEHLEGRTFLIRAPHPRVVAWVQVRYMRVIADVLSRAFVEELGGAHAVLVFRTYSEPPTSRGNQPS